MKKQAPPKKQPAETPKPRAKAFDEREQLALAKALRAKRKQPTPKE